MEGQPEVGQVDAVDGVGRPWRIEEDVARGDVAVDEPELVGGVEGLGGLLDDCDGAAEVERAIPANEVGERCTPLHRDKQPPIDLAGAVDRDDVGG